MVNPEKLESGQRLDETQAAGRNRRPPVAGTMNATPGSVEHDAAEGEGQYFDHTGLTFLHRAYRRLAMHQRRSMNPHVLSGAEPLQHVTWTGDKPLRLTTSRLGDIESLSLSFSVLNVRTLVQAYFETCVVTYRMFHEPTVLGWLNVDATYPSAAAHAHGQTEAHRLFPLSFVLGNAKTAILLTLMAITALRAEKIKNRFECIWDEEQVLLQTDHYFQLASTFIDSEVGPATLESAQARLIQVLYLLQTARMNRAWYQLGTAYQVLVALGLHRKQNNQGQEGTNSRVNTYSTSTSVPPNDYVALQCQLRTFWVAYSIDVYMSVVLGRPRYFHDDDINQTFPEPINDEHIMPYGPLDELRNPSILSKGNKSDRNSDNAGNFDLLISVGTRAESNMESMIAHAQLSRIISEISRAVYSLKPLPRKERLLAARHCGQSLHAWRAGLATHLKSIHPSSLIPSLRRQAIALQLAYCHAVIHANRPFLLSTDDIVEEHTIPTQGTLEDYAHAANESVIECISAARTALHIIETMASDTSVMNALWWMPYVLFCALVVVYVWKIEQNARRKVVGHASGNDHYDGFRSVGDLGDNVQNILALAERCHLLLSRDFRPSTDDSSSFPSQMADSPSRRYSIILEELRLEARKNSAEDVPFSPQPPVPLRTPNFTIAVTPMSRHQQNMMIGQASFQDQDNVLNVPIQTTSNDSGDMYGASGQDAAATALPPMSFQEWQTSDWLGLDASVSHPLSLFLQFVIR